MTSTRPISLERFLARLRQTPRTWRLIPQLGGVHVLRNLNGHCPLAATQSRLSRTHEFAVVAAADQRMDYDRTLRQHLLEACGVDDR